MHLLWFPPFLRFHLPDLAGFCQTFYASGLHRAASSPLTLFLFFLSSLFQTFWLENRVVSASKHGLWYCPAWFESQLCHLSCVILGKSLNFSCLFPQLENGGNISIYLGLLRRVNELSMSCMLHNCGLFFFIVLLFMGPHFIINIPPTPTSSALQ